MKRWNAKRLWPLLGSLLVLAAAVLLSARYAEKKQIGKIVGDLRRLAAATQVRRGRDVRYRQPVFFKPASAAGRNIVLISLDTLRADRLNCYGYRRRITSPQIDRFALEATLFENCFAGSPGTLSSQMSLLTGYYPSSHGVSYRQYGKMVRKKERKNERVPDDLFLRLPGIPDSTFTLAEILKAHGYHTVGVHEGGYLSAPLGYSRGFDHFFCSQSYALNPDPGKKAEGLKKTYFRAIAALKDTPRPFFLFFHTYEIHSPYIHEDSGGRRPAGGDEYFSECYDNGIRYADRYVGHLLRWLKAKKMWDDTIVVLTSDHGEEFGDHYPIWYSGHGQSQYQEQLRVPLLVHGGGPASGAGRMRRVRENVQTVDIAPTLLALALGESHARRLLAHPDLRRDGSSFLPLLTTGHGPDRPVYFEDSYKGPERIGMVANGYKLIVKYKPAESVMPFAPGSEADLAVRRTPARELFFLPDDPRERNNLWRQLPDRAGRMEKELLSRRRALLRLKKPGRRNRPGIDAQSLRELKALGYLN